jgi:hypothetical protein
VKALPILFLALLSTVRGADLPIDTSLNAGGRVDYYSLTNDGRSLVVFRLLMFKRK